MVERDEFTISKRYYSVNSLIGALTNNKDGVEALSHNLKLSIHPNNDQGPKKKKKTKISLGLSQSNPKSLLKWEDL